MSGHLPSLLLVGTDDALRASQATLFRRRKYKVSETTPSDAIVALASGFDIAVLNHTIPPAKRQKIADSIKKHTPDKLVLVLHASGGLRARNVDAAVDSRNGGDAILKALDHLVLMKAVRDHNRSPDRRDLARAPSKRSGGSVSGVRKRRHDGRRVYVAPPFGRANPHLVLSPCPARRMLDGCVATQLASGSRSRLLTSLPSRPSRVFSIAFPYEQWHPMGIK